MTATCRLGVAALAALTTACSPEPVTLGIAMGSATAVGAHMALEDARAAGFDVPLDTVVIYEANNLAGPAVRTADTLVSEAGLVAVVGHSNSAASLTAAPIYNQAQVVQVAPHSTAELYSEAGPYSFRMVPPDGQQGRVLARFLEREFAGRRVAVSYVNDDYGRGLRASVLEALHPGAVEVVADLPHITIAPAEMVRNTVLGLVDARPDVILWLGRIHQLVHYLPEIREALGRIPVVGGDALNPVEALPDPDRLYPPMHFVRLLDLNARPETRRFAERYRERAGQDPADAAALTYDAVSVLLAGIRAGARSGDELRTYLASLGRDRPAYPGITGPVRFDEHGNADRSYVMGHLTLDGGAP
jgi:branched-chain amino acid transport system substrate-binding protein